MNLNNKKIPTTDSISELTAFWDTHDLTDFEDELEEIPERVFARETTTEAETVITLRLSPPETETIERLANSRGMRPAGLIHEWIAEKTGPKNDVTAYYHAGL